MLKSRVSRNSVAFSVREAVLAFVLAVTFIPSVVANVQAQPRVRTLPYSLEPIVNQLLPDDEVVLIHREFDVAVFYPEPTVSESIVYSAQLADVVAVVDVSDVDATLVEQGTWIQTRLVGTVRQVLRSSRRSRFVRGQRVEAHLHGGQLRIGHVLIKTDPLLETPAHRRYLLFLTPDGLSPGLGVAHRPLLVENGRLVDTEPPNAPEATPDPLNGLALSEVTKQVRRVK